MENIALVFPGQGSQYVGMAKDFYDSFDAAKKIIDRADEIVGKNFRNIIFTGPEEELKKTDITQPAIFTMSVLIYEIVKEKFANKISFCAGHSLGEYSALYAAGAFNFETGLALVMRRGDLMQIASDKNKGGMAAIIGFTIDKINEICEKVKGDGYLTVANINSPNQIVVSGEISAIEKAEKIAIEYGAKRYIKLNVAGAFHSTLMQYAADILKNEINNYEIKDLIIPVIANYSAKEVKTEEEIKDSLIKQIISPVRWVETIEYIKSKNVSTFIEIGPGTVLSGLIKKVDKNLKIYNIDKVQDIEKINI